MKHFIYLLLFLFAFSGINMQGQNFYFGADLSYVNEMEDCGAVYYENDQAKDPFLIFREHQANLVRFRIWHTPDWTEYSNFEDVATSIQRAKAAGFSVLLDFHYSDTWADPGNQLRPQAWQTITDLNILADSLYNYTYHTLEMLQAESLLPEMVQIGNETNGNILLNPGEPLSPLQWSRNILLFESAILAVQQINTDFGTNIKTMIHIAKPETALWWFGQAANNGFSSFDIMGISYYPGWSELGIREAANAIKTLKETYNKEVMIAETGYPWTLAWADNNNNLLGSSNLLKYYGDVPSPELQKQFLIELSWLVRENGGSGVIYWEPDWVSTDCSTPWGIGSNWENATFFDFDNKLHQGIGFMDYDYSIKPAALDSVKVSFFVDMTGVDTTNGVFVTGDFTGTNWQFMQMKHIGENIFTYSRKMGGRSTGAYIFQNQANWTVSSRETVPSSCALKWGTHREYVVGSEDAVFGFVWGSCSKLEGVGIKEYPEKSISISPNPVKSNLIVHAESGINSVKIFDLSGHQVIDISGSGSTQETIGVSQLPTGIYFVQVSTRNHYIVTQKIIKHEK